MRQTFLSILLMLLPMMASADAVEIGGIWYNLVAKAKEAEVTNNQNSYSGNVVIPPSVTYDGQPYSVTSIGENAFFVCRDLTSVTIPNSVTSISASAFYDCTSLTSVNISDLAAWCNIKFGDNPLKYAHHLYINGNEITNLVIPNNVTSIGSGAFFGCSGLTSVTIPNSVTSIGQEAFSGCSGLTSVTIPNSVTFISDYAFAGCSGLTSITIPNSVTSIGNVTFAGCTGLTSVTIPNSVSSIGGSAFSGCSGLTSVTIPNSVTTIGNQAFYGCSGLASVTIPSSVTYIDNQAFSGSGLTSVTIPNSVTYIGEQAFANCVELTDVYCLAEKLRNDPYNNDEGLYTRSDAFMDSYPQAMTLHVPAASISAYQAIEPWKYFKGPVAVSGGTPPPTPTTKCATPVISYSGGKIEFTCATDGVDFVSSVTSADVNSYTGSTINLTLKFTVSVYATKAGLDNSDEATKDIEIVIGDMDGDGNVNAADIVKLVNKVMNP